MNIGCFEVTKVSTGKWKCVNTLTTFEHVTYGAEDDVRSQLEKQSIDWERRFADKEAKKPGRRAQEKWSQNRSLAPMKRNPIIGSDKSEAGKR